MARPKILFKPIVMSMRIDEELHQIMQDIAYVESLRTGRKISVMQLARDALRYVYMDNERLRECFRRSRAHITKRSL